MVIVIVTVMSNSDSVSDSVSVVLSVGDGVCR
jgi:hypothetical protein